MVNMIQHKHAIGSKCNNHWVDFKYKQINITKQDVSCNTTHWQAHAINSYFLHLISFFKNVNTMQKDYRIFRP